MYAFTKRKIEEMETEREEREIDKGVGERGKG